MRSVLALAVAAVAVLGFEGSARAGETDVCLAAPVEGQKLQRAGKLVAARERFVTCARPECPADIVSHCERWAREVSQSIPSLVVVARDSEAHDLPGVRVRIDGGPPAERSERAIELDPGEHRVTVERDGFDSVELPVILHDGEKNRAVHAVFGAGETGPRVSPSDPARPPIVTRPVPARVWIASGVGVLGLASFGLFAAMGASDRLDSHCDTGCPTPVKDRVDAQLMAADISLGVGLVALGVATWMFLARPTVQRSAAQAPVFSALMRWK
jgi:hypothetical protein